MANSIINFNIFPLKKKQYGVSILAKANKIKKLRIKYGNYINHPRYSLRCLHNDLVLKNLSFTCNVNTGCG